MRRCLLLAAAGGLLALTMPTACEAGPGGRCGGHAKPMGGGYAFKPGGYHGFGKSAGFRRGYFKPQGFHGGHGKGGFGKPMSAGGFKAGGKIGK